MIGIDLSFRLGLWLLRCGVESAFLGGRVFVRADRIIGVASLDRSFLGAKNTQNQTGLTSSLLLIQMFHQQFFFPIEFTPLYTGSPCNFSDPGHTSHPYMVNMTERLTKYVSLNSSCFMWDEIKSEYPFSTSYQMHGAQPFNCVWSSGLSLDHNTWPWDDGLGHPSLFFVATLWRL